MKDLTLVIPAKNEPESLPYVLMELDKLDLDFLVVLEKTDFVTINAKRDMMPLDQYVGVQKHLLKNGFTVVQALQEQM